ncbi:MAG TPA: hypothetical protein VIM65_03345, partial [Cyclobacteriaceae bacterium]
AYQLNYDKNKLVFIQAEKERVESFQYMYTISKIVATIFFTCTLIIFWLSENPTLRGWGIGLAIFAISGLVVDYFSQERAENYYQAIVEALT